MIELEKYTSPQCRYCPAVSNYVNELEESGQLDGIIISYHNALNLSEEARAKVNVSSVPTLIFKRNGLEITRITGMTDQETILDCLKMAREDR
jgi:thioredoxin 1